jgi:hypothetical protein
VKGGEHLWFAPRTGSSGADQRRLGWVIGGGSKKWGKTSAPQGVGNSPTSAADSDACPSEMPAQDAACGVGTDVSCSYPSTVSNCGENQCFRNAGEGPSGADGWSCVASCYAADGGS